MIIVYSSQYVVKSMYNLIKTLFIIFFGNTYFASYRYPVSLFSLSVIEVAVGRIPQFNISCLQDFGKASKQIVQEIDKSMI